MPYKAPSWTTSKDFTLNPLLCQPKKQFVVEKFKQIGALNKN